MKTNQAKKELEKLDAEIKLLQDKKTPLENIIKKEGLRELRKKYVGKCYKCRDSFGDGRDWWVYTKIYEVNRAGFLNRREFGCIPEYNYPSQVREFIFRYNSFVCAPVSRYIKISQKEYNQALKKALSLLHKNFVEREK